MKVTVAGKTLTDRVWLLIEDAALAANIPADKVRVLQGSYNAGKVAASAGTHDAGGAFDLSVTGLTLSQQWALIKQLRIRNAAAWIRSPRYDWTSTGPHIHGIVKDEPDLSRGAKVQVADYDKGLNGLANKGKDPHKRPKQYPIEKVMLMAWPVGKQKMVKSGEITVQGGRWVNLAKITLPKGARFKCTLQVRMPRGVGAGEAHLGRLGWGEDATKPTDIDMTGHNAVAPASVIQRWRTPIQGHTISGGGPLAYRVWLPTGAHKIKFVAKAERVF